jgi:hypothetical protein
MGFADEMAGTEEAYAETEAAVSTGGRFTDGRHGAVIVELRVEKSTKTDVWQLCWKFQGRDSNIRVPTIASVRRWDDLPPNETRMPYVKGDLEMIGYSGPLSGLEEFCQSEAAIGLLCTIGVKTNQGDERDFTNVYLNGCTGEKVVIADYLESLGLSRAAAENGGSATGSGAVDDDIPF